MEDSMEYGSQEKLTLADRTEYGSKSDDSEERGVNVKTLQEVLNIIGKSRADSNVDSNVIIQSLTKT